MCGIYQGMDVARIHPVRERALRALSESVDFIDQEMPNAIGYETQKEITEYALSQIKVAGYHLEFGVFTGGTTRFIANRLKNDTQLYGFDSFEGLPEDWAGFQLSKSAFSVGGKLPKVPKNVSLIPGWYDHSLPLWAGSHEGPIAFIHIDCDLYSSTKTIFNQLSHRFQPGTILLFDEYFNFAGWKQHEHKAFIEMIDANGFAFSYLAYARQQVVVRIEKI
jgi:predicted O-methyltransferase YrrM